MSAVPTPGDWGTVLLCLFEGFLALHGHRVTVTAGDQQRCRERDGATEGGGSTQLDKTAHTFSPRFVVSRTRLSSVDKGAPLSRRIVTAEIAPGGEKSDTEGGEEKLEADVALTTHCPERDDAAMIGASRIEALASHVRRHEQSHRDRRNDGRRRDGKFFPRRRRRGWVIAPMLVAIMVPGKNPRSEMAEWHRTVQVLVEGKYAATEHEDTGQRRGNGKAG